MIIESILISSGAVAAKEAVDRAKKRRADAADRATWLHAIQTSQSINAQLSAARRAMVNEVRRHNGVAQIKDGAQ